MASGTNPRLLRLQAHNISATSSLHDSHPGTPWREDDEHAPLLRPGDIDRAAFGAHRSYNFLPHTYCLHLGELGHDLEADVVKSSMPVSTTWAKAQYYMPSLYWIPNYTLSLYEFLNRFNLRVYM